MSGDEMFAYVNETAFGKIRRYPVINASYANASWTELHRDYPPELRDFHYGETVIRFLELCADLPPDELGKLKPEIQDELDAHFEEKLATESVSEPEDSSSFADCPYIPLSEAKYDALWNLVGKVDKIELATSYGTITSGPADLYTAPICETLHPTAEEEDACEAERTGRVIPELAETMRKFPKAVTDYAEATGLTNEAAEAVISELARTAAPVKGIPLTDLYENNFTPKADYAETMRKFDTGATRDTAEGKLEYSECLSPAVLEAYAKYMLKHAEQPDGSRRPGGNWKKGIPQDSYMSSMFRHFHDVWMLHEGRFRPESGVDMEEALCALTFNVMGYLDTLLTERARTPKPSPWAYGGSTWKPYGLGGGVSTFTNDPEVEVRVTTDEGES